MNEQAIRDAYDLFVKNGYSDSIDDFKKLIASNNEALTDSYNLFKDNGYGDSIDDYKSLMGLSADKKKVTTVSPSAVGSSASSKTPTERVSVGPMGMVGLERTKEYEPDGKQGWLLNTVSSLDKGFYKNLVGNPVKGLGTLLEGATGKGFVSDALIKFGNYFNNAIDELTPQDEEFKNSLSDQFGQAFGQVVSLATTAGAGALGAAGKGAAGLAEAQIAAKAAPKAITALGLGKAAAAELASPTAVSAGLSMGQSEFDRAKQAGATDDQAFEAFYKNAVVGSVLEKVPVMQFMKRFNKSTAGGLTNYIKTKGVAGLTGGVEEMTTEVLQGLYANLAAKDIYNVNQDIYEGLAESGGVGLGVGFLLNAMGANAKILRKQGKEEEANVVEAQINELESRAKKGGKSSYKINGIKIDSPDAITKMIDKMSATDLAKANIEIKNDPELNKRLQEKIVVSSVKEQVRQGNPDLNEPSLDAITKLELELRKLEGNTTQTGKDKAAAIRTQIKNIQENQLTEEVDNSARIAELEGVLSSADKNLAETGTSSLSEDARTEIEKELQTLKSKQDVQKQTAGEVSVQSGAGVGEEVAQGKPQAEPQVTTEEGVQAEVVQEEVAPELTEQEQDIERNRLSDKVFEAKKNIARAEDTEAAIGEYNAAKKELDDFESSIEQKKDTKRAKSNVSSIIEDEKTYSQRAGYEYKELYDQDPRLAALQNAKDMVEWFESGESEKAAIDRGENLEEAKKSIERSLKYIQQNIADLEADLEANPVVSSKTQEAAPVTELTEEEQKIGTQLNDLVSDFTTAYSQPSVAQTTSEKRTASTKATKAVKKLNDFFGFTFGSRANEEQASKQDALSYIKSLLDQGSTSVQFANITELMNAYKSDKQNNVESPLVESVDAIFGITPTVSSKTQEVAPATEAVLEIEQYEPITVKQVSNEKFTKDNAIEYEEDVRETDSGREVTYLSRIVVEAIDDNSGDAIGGLVKIIDEDKTVSWQAQDLDGNELGKEPFDSKDEAKAALVNNWNKIQKKEFDKEAKKKAKEKEKEAAKKSKFAKDETVRPQPTGDRTGRTESSAIAPLEGAPSVPGVNGPDPQLVAVAEQYAKANGIPFKRQAEYVKVDEKRAKRIADAYEAMANDPQNPKVKEAYQNLIKQTIAQYKALEDAGYKFWFMDLNIPSNAEYASTPYNAIRDLRKSKEMGVFPTTDGYGDGGLTELDVENNPMLADTGLKWPVGGLDGEMKTVLANDLFRAVHDAFGHGLEGAGFRARGEENAWQAHVRLFTGSAIAAITSETRGQNSWLNYGPNGEQNKTAKVEDTVFAEQKVGLMPKWTWTEGKAADMKPAPKQKQKQKAAPIVEEEGPTAEDLSAIDALLDLDVENEDNMQIVLNALDNADKAITKRLRGSANDALLAIPLSTIQLVVKSLKALVKGGMMLRDAIKKVAADNNVSQQIVKDILNVTDIQEGFDALMVKVDEMIDRQTRRGTPEARMVSNIDTFVRNSEVYQNANDAQKKILEREARARAGVSARRAPSIGRILGVLKDITNVSREDKLSIISKIRQLSKDAAKDLAAEIKSLAKEGTITANQAANVIARFGKVNLLNEVSVSSFVDYMAKVFKNAEYVEQISRVQSMLKTAKKNVQTKIGAAEALTPLLNKVFSIKPTMIPDSAFEDYVSIVEMIGERKTVLSLQESGQLTDRVNKILDAMDNEYSRVKSLIEMVELYKDKVIDEDGNLDLTSTIKKMVKDKSITEQDAEVIRKYRGEIVPRETPEKKSEKELAEEKAQLVKTVKESEIDFDGLPMKDERDKARELQKLIKTDAVQGLNNATLNNLIRVIDNINNGYFPNFAQLMVERLNAINNAKVVEGVTEVAKPYKLEEIYAKLKSMITDKDKFSELVRRKPLYYIEQAYGNFKTKEIFNSIFEKPAQAQAAYESDEKNISAKLDKAEKDVSKSFNQNPNKTLESKFKMMTYMIQLEHDSNPDSDQVNQAKGFLEATIKHINNGRSTFGERDAKFLDGILKNKAYQKSNGEIDATKLYNTFNPAEKKAIKVMQDINASLRDKAVYTASVIRGNKISPLNNYIHRNVLHEYRPEESLIGVSFIQDFNSSLRPSTRAESLIERTGDVSPLNFDVFASVNRGAKFVLMDYYLTEPIRTVRKTINETKKLIEKKIDKRNEKQKENPISEQAKKKQDASDKMQMEVLNSINNAFEEVVDNVLTNNFSQTSFFDKVADYISRQGYRAVLTSIPRFAAELLSNSSFVALAAPKQMLAGIKNSDVVKSADMPMIMKNVKSTEINRLFPHDTLSGRFVDTSILEQAGGIKGGRAKNDVANKIQQIYNLSLKKYTNPIELMADAITSSPDKMVMIPLWYGSFVTKFESVSGKKLDEKKVAENDEAYMSENEEALTEARREADRISILTGATSNPFLGVLKGKDKQNQSVGIKLFNRFNNFMTNFLIYEYTTARIGIQAAMGNGSLSERQGFALMAAVTTRMTLYTLLVNVLGTAMLDLFVDDEEADDEKTIVQKIGQAIASSATSIILGRDFGNATKAVINQGVEYGNEKFLDFLRAGEYDPYKDAIQYTVMPPERKGKQAAYQDMIMNMMGPFGPAVKTSEFAFRKATEPEKKTEEARQRVEKEKTIRLPLEILGNLGMIPLYKDIRKIVNKEIYKGLEKAEAQPQGSKMSKEDMKKYFPDMYNELYGPGGTLYDIELIQKQMRKEKEKLTREMKDEMYNYTPK